MTPWAMARRSETPRELLDVADQDQHQLRKNDYTTGSYPVSENRRANNGDPSEGPAFRVSPTLRLHKSPMVALGLRFHPLPSGCVPCASAEIAALTARWHARKRDLGTIHRGEVLRDPSHQRSCEPPSTPLTPSTHLMGFAVRRGTSVQRAVASRLARPNPNRVEIGPWQATASARRRTAG